MAVLGTGLGVVRAIMAASNSPSASDRSVSCMSGEHGIEDKVGAGVVPVVFADSLTRLHSRNKVRAKSRASTMAGEAGSQSGREGRRTVQKMN